ncbi:hypothetical protein CEXT_675991 [Caerostris extrusa]|uniref:Uncharacterized protein n=1 Tax=Caerostris extrusa TaxID=172846 RepID=A0AAV4MMT2_CAEEX|nr:hypothetical protein CEXT_675991 [Caerostris extrusa]
MQVSLYSVKLFSTPRTPYQNNIMHQEQGVLIFPENLIQINLHSATCENRGQALLKNTLHNNNSSTRAFQTSVPFPPTDN